MKFNFNEYIKLLNEEKIDLANRYRMDNIPKKLFKYTEFSEDIIFNEKKLKNLFLDDELWMARVSALNDPFELKAFYLDRKKLEENKYSLIAIDNLEKALAMIRSLYIITSLTSTGVNNMPMWAHYSNNHTGYCIEFEIVNPITIYPVTYEKKRIGIASIITNYLKLASDVGKRIIDENNNEFLLYRAILQNSTMIKHESWSYENEYRVIIPMEDDLLEGHRMNLNTQGLKIKSIYLGIKCSPENEEYIRELLGNTKIDVYKMEMAEYGSDYELRY